MATALDLLMDTKEDVNLLSEESDICTIDAKTRAIFVPSTIVVGGVQSDKNAERIKFSCPKIVGDNLDLSKFSVRINFENVSSVDFNVSIKDQYICDDVAVDGENVTFSWLIGRNAARYMGTVRFIVCAVKTDSDSNISVEWNTAIAEVPVLEGIEIDQPQIGQEEKDVINQLLELTKNTSAEAVQNVNSAKEQAIKDIQSVSQPDTTLTIEGGLAEAKATGEAISSLKEDLGDLNNVIVPSKKVGKSNVSSGWTKKEVIKNIDFKKNELYSIKISLDYAPTDSAYVYISTSDDADLTVIQMKGVSKNTYAYTPSSDYIAAKISFAGNYTGSITITVDDGNNSIKKLEEENDVVYRMAYNGYTTFTNDFVIGEHYSNFSNNDKRVVMDKAISFDYDVYVMCSNGFEINVCVFNEEDTFLTSYGWKHNGDIHMIPKGTYFRIMCNKYPSSETVKKVKDYTDNILYYTKNGNNFFDNLKNKELLKIICNKKFFHHIDVSSANPIIPSQSIFDIHRAKRLGFDIIELNCRKTSDGIMYSFHGSGGKFGGAFHSVDNTDISNISVDTVTDEYIQTNIRYNSIYDKYRVCPTRMMEALVECKKLGLIPLVEYSDGVVELCESIMGENNFIISMYTADRIQPSNYICASWLTGSAEDIIKKANKSGGAYICSINVTDQMYANYTKGDWEEFAGKIHKAGYYISCTYQNEEQLQKLIGCFDLIGSEYNINLIESGNILNIDSGMDFSGIENTGSIENGTLKLESGDTASNADKISITWLGGGDLRIIFDGKIKVSMGVINEKIFESNGKEIMCFSSYFQNGSPSFLIEAVENTTIKELIFKASKF